MKCQPAGRRGDDRQSTSKQASIALGLFALLFSLYTLTFSGVYHSSDEISMLVATDSLARRGAWDIEFVRWMGEQQGTFGPDGHLYSRKGIGTTLAALPLYWAAVQSGSLGNVQTAMLTNAFVTALTAVVIYLYLRRLRYGDGASLGTALIFGTATIAWPYARYLFSESLAGLGLMLSAYFLLRFRDLDDRASPLLAGLGLGIALLARLSNAIVAPFLGLLLLAYLYRRHGRNWRAWIGPILLFGLPALAALAVTGWYNWLRFGSLLSTGYLPEERFATPFLEGFYGLTFSPGKGFFWYSPILLAALAGWPSFLRRHRAEGLLVAAVVLSNVAFYASWYLWWAGHSWGPRFLVTILPFASLPLAPVLEAAARRKLLTVGLGLLVIVSIAVQVLGVAVDFNLYLEDIHAELGLYHPATLFDPAHSPLLRQIGYLRLQNLDLAWARGGTVDWAALAVGLGLVVISALALWAAFRGKLSIPLRVGLAVLLGLGTVYSLIRYAPAGDTAHTARAMASMERQGEAGALTKPLLTEAFQDAYDGRLWVWGVPSGEHVGDEYEAVWVIGNGGADPATARFQVGEIRLDLLSATDQPFDRTRLPIPPLETDARLGDTAELEAIQLEETTVKQGGTLSLALYWRALTGTDGPYTVFVQVIDEDGVKAGQIDRLPCNGTCPTDTWRPGDLIGERFDLSIRTDAPPGVYQVIAGMYDPETGERLPWLDAKGNEVGTYLALGSVDVQQ